MLLVNPSTYIAATLFLGVMGFMFTGILESYSKTPQDTSPAQVFFSIFWFPVLFIVPLLTMKCLAEERRLGTIETLLTTPVTTTEVVLAKYSAAYLLYVSLWACTGGFFYILKKFSGDAHFIDLGPLIGGYLFVAVSGSKRSLPLFDSMALLGRSVVRQRLKVAAESKDRTMNDKTETTALSSDVTEVRAQKLKLLREQIGDVYPAHFHRTMTNAELAAKYENLELDTETQDVVTVAGR
eukprot:gene50965-62329_t